MTVIAHMSDLHFGRAVPEVTQALLDCLDQLQPELVIISGDLTQRAKDEEFKQGMAFLRKLRQPRFIVPGNHDLTAYNLLERLLYPWQKWQQYVAADLQPIMQTDAFMAVGLNTARRMGWYTDWSRGRINPGQIRYVQDMLQDVPADCLRIVVAHHPFWLPDSSMCRSLVGGREAALEGFQAAGVDLILGGHVHLAYVQPLHGMLISHAGTTTSNRLIQGQPNSFNVIRGDREILKLEQMEWRGTAFVPVQQQFFKRAAGGWQVHGNF
ncbi:metallophosphoesterase family protein [Candidatus Thiothrix sp. Deng01]|uniref:Metallophosphoesterase family protein n=1 Tax=Candidatus Thiothrix phosphatis TaxID=3112415 RepID=A0ABU6D1Z4_9GAMM|nr:metallophosphoesterase family protein [Candidatus Thiothrix sp. Deng01]MEB4592353.1 metallophosphoesterase family protein [Candidatus Thiothrix sp. Deng01]